MQILRDDLKDLPITITLPAEQVVRLIAAAVSDIIVSPETIDKLQDAFEKEIEKANAPSK